MRKETNRSLEKTERQTRPLHRRPDPIAAALITSKQRVKTTLTKTLYIYQQKKKGKQRADLLQKPRQTRVERTPDGSRGRICPHGGGSRGARRVLRFGGTSASQGRLT